MMFKFLMFQQVVHISHIWHFIVLAANSEAGLV